MWICPVCERAFKNPNQSHSCEIYNEDWHLHAKSEKIKEIYHALTEKLNELKDIRYSHIKNAVTVAAGSTFVAIKLKKDFIEVEFLFDREIHESPVYKIFRVSKSRVAHYVKLHNKKDISPELIQWIHQSYNIVNRK